MFSNNYAVLFVFLKYVYALDFVPADKLNKTLQVLTASGFIQGKEELSVLGKTYFSYLGIPYAKPPIGNLRFRDPMNIRKWSDILDATKFGSCCGGLSLTNVNDLQLDVVGEEDCLYLNVYTPKVNNDRVVSNLPVMLYIHGGAFFLGCGNNYEPDFFMENDVVLVVPNYRLAVFGYLSTEDIECPGNWALKDIIAVLKWIQINIHQFGGDPNKVTIFGQSSGAANVNSLLISSKTRGLFHGAILMSGSSLNYWSYQVSPRKIAFDVGLALGIETNSTKMLIKYLRNVAYKDLLRGQLPAIFLNLLTILSNGFPFTPTVEPKHKRSVLSSSYTYHNMENGRFNKVPVMVGTTNSEMNLIIRVLNILRTVLPVLDLTPGILVRFTQDNRNKTIVGNLIKNHFISSKSYATASTEEILKLISEDFFTRSLLKVSSLMAEYVPVYFYQFTYEGDIGVKCNELYTGLNKRIMKGAAHGEDICYLFYDKRFTQNKEDLEFSRKLARIFTNFAKNGNPTPTKELLLDNVTWPKVTKEKFPYLDIGRNLKVVNQNFDEENYQFWEYLYRTYSQKPYNVY